MVLYRETDRQLENCTFAKTVLMMIIVLYHSMLYWKNGTAAQSNAVLCGIANWFAGFHNYCFFLISGYIYYFLRYEKNQYAYYLPFIRKKAKRLVIPAVFIGFFWVAPINGYLSHYTIRDYLIKIVLACSPSHLWFLWSLFFMFVLCWPLSDFLKQHNILGLEIVGLLFVAGIVGGYFHINVFNIFSACAHFCYFYIGFKIREYRVSLGRFTLIAGIILYTVMIVVKLVIPKNGVTFMAVNELLELFYKVIGSITAFFVLQYIAERVRWKESSAFSFISRRAMPIYLFHQQITHLSQHFLNGHMNPYVNVLLNFAFSISLGIVLSSLMMRHKATRYLIGEQ